MRYSERDFIIIQPINIDVILNPTAAVTTVWAAKQPYSNVNFFPPKLTAALWANLFLFLLHPLSFFASFPHFTCLLVYR